MPNWCDCDLSVRGPCKDLLAMVKQVQTPIPDKPIAEIVMDRLTKKPEPEVSLIDANQIIPYPEEYAEKDRIAREWQEKHGFFYIAGKPKDGFNSGGYDWCIENWGTKWGFGEITRVIKAQSVYYNFRTAWSPPSPLIKKLGQMFPTLTFVMKYYEGGVGFQGILRIAKGKVIDDKNVDYKGRRGG